MNYIDLFANLNYDPRIVGIVSGALRHPESYVMQNVEPPIILPAVLPMWCESINTTGILRHWFSSNRSETYIVQKPEFKYAVDEIAVTVDQLVALESYISIANKDGKVSESVKKFSSPFSTVKIIELVELFEKYDLDEGKLSELHYFKGNMPHCFCEGDYSGNFPVYSNSISSITLRNSCTIEYRMDELQEISKLEYAPEWFKVNNQEPLFYKLLLSNDLAGAWMCLNSNGWLFKDAKKAIKRLADQANDRDFHILTESWTSLPLEINGGY
ncbi:hypothetical protein QCD60_15625 [Pokkaliibacter sp. MBI-7]|uniref:hypothetical protein n=1 Tax=Pokkaliibacter sp. MBI-7 TaxID=3040600 RepID=UPI00244914A5|nr:hypothetical protein [Pokkaliibacter sp. MBI-7]MDH2433996.1 hypothetical protein [Pokkaliibacter sp. MBI-7]